MSKKQENLRAARHAARENSIQRQKEKRVAETMGYRIDDSEPEEMTEELFEEATEELEEMTEEPNAGAIEELEEALYESMADMAVKTGTEEKPEIVRKPKEKKAFRDLPFFRFFLNNRDGKSLALKILILVLIPIAYPFVCGLVIEEWLQVYTLRTAIAIVLLVLYAFNIILIVLAIVYYCKDRKNKQFSRKR